MAALQGLPFDCVCPGMDDIEYVLTLLEHELANEPSLDETFDLERDDTKEVTLVVDFEDQWTQPFELEQGYCSRQ